MNADAIKNLQEFNRLLIQVVREVVEQAPTSWESGIFLIHKYEPDIRCELLATDEDQSTQIKEPLLCLSRQFASCKRTDNWDNNWLSIKIHFSFSDPSVDYSATYEFIYSEETLDSASQEKTNSLLPNESFWRQEIADNAWERSPSLLVMALILDYGNWQASTTPHSSKGQYELNQILRKYCRSFDSADITAQLIAHRHHISIEAICSAETFSDHSVVTTDIHQNPGSAPYFEYDLVREQNRWFLTKIAPKFSFP